MNNITIELSQEDRARLDIIAGKLGAIHDLLKSNTHDCERCANSVATVVAGIVEQSPAPVEETQTSEDTAPWEGPADAEEPVKAEPAPEQPAVSQADVQKKVVELSAAGKKDAVKEIVQAYAPRVSAIPEDKLIEVWQKLTALEG